MYYLDQKQFKPEMILLGILFVPCIIGLIIANILQFSFKSLILLLIILMSYLTIVFILWKLSNRKKYYLILKDDRVILEFHDVINGKIKLELEFNQITKFIYYRANSIKGWSMLFVYNLPKCVFIRYNANGKEQQKFIGHLDVKDIKEISYMTDTELKIY